MTTATDVSECRDPIAEYRFSEFGTNVAISHADQHCPQARKASASLLVTGLVLGGLTGTSIGSNYGSISSFVTVGRTDRGELAPLEDSKPTTVVARPAGREESRSDRDEVMWIKEHSGLTWDQLGKVFGVSRRAVHMWANGGRLNESNARRLREFSAIIRGVESETPRPTPEVVRARLLQVDSDGMSSIDRLRRERSTGRAWGAPFGPERLVGATREPLRTPVGEVGL